MPTDTSKGFPYPEAADPDKPRLDLQALAEFLNALPGVRTVTQSERDVLVDLWPGMLIFNSTNGHLEINKTGTAGDWEWVVDSKQPIPISEGGTGLNTAPSMFVRLDTITADSPFQAFPRPGTQGILPIDKGGTGDTTDTDFVAAFEAAL
ncbi:hypothetical protein [Microbacterium karelineae]|uniref:hypothetical protein n=1 Tax=Microbacterium karelineae TaxID=2654283 RepID=UPI0012EA1CC2|nr:hypothetical protein [Microbacterium karelineae]